MSPLIFTVAPGAFDVTATAALSTRSAPRYGARPAEIRHSSWSLRVSIVSTDVGLTSSALRALSMQSCHLLCAFATAARKRYGPGSFGSIARAFSR